MCCFILFTFLWNEISYPNVTVPVCNKWLYDPNIIQIQSGVNQSDETTREVQVRVLSERSLGSVWPYSHQGLYSSPVRNNYFLHFIDIHFNFLCLFMAQHVGVSNQWIIIIVYFRLYFYILPFYFEKVMPRNLCWQLDSFRNFY